MGTEGERLLQLKVNGRDVRVSIPPNLRLIDLLRDVLQLTGTKEGCGEGDCGACTVLLDGRPVNSCLVMARQAAGHEVTTIEGVGTPGELHPIQQAFLDHGAVQCGYCTPGMVLSAKALLDANPAPTREESRVAISGNLCRCTGYSKIVDAIASVAGQMAAGATATTATNATVGISANVVGRPVRRVDGIAKVTGQARYPADIYLPDMLYGMTLRSKYPYARILRMDTSRAEQVPGVWAVLTGKDVPGENNHGVLFQDQPVLADRIVKSAADPIAIVAAESREAAAEAIELIQVEYEELTPIFDPVAAMQPGAPQLHENWPGNILHHQRIRKGDVEKGFARAEVIVENTYTTQMAEHLFLQPEAAVARVDERGHVVIQVATQYPHYDRTAVARILGIGVNEVRIAATAIGGAFGAREDITLQGHAALLAWKTRRPVKMVYSREESVLAHCKRHPMIMKYRTGATKDGKLTALEATIIGNTGAYASWGINILRKAAVHATGPYEIPNVAVDAYAVFTNAPFAGAMRGFGAPQPAIAYEGQMDEVAAALGIHPFTIRMRNALQVGSVTGTGQLLESSVGLKETLRRAAEASRLNVAERGAGERKERESG